MLYRHVINMNEEKWEVKRRNIEEYVLTRRASGTYFIYDVRIERDEKGKLRRLIIDMTTNTIELPPIAFQIFGLLTERGILKEGELLGR